MEKVSIIIPCYNAAETILTTLRSLENQMCKDFQVVLVNDGSNDNTKQIIERYQFESPYKILFIDKENGGVSSARNAGIDAVTTPYLSFLDADDIYSPFFIQNLLGKLEEQHTDFCVAQYKFVDDLNHIPDETDNNAEYSLLTSAQLIDLYYHHRTAHVNFGDGIYKTSIIKGNNIHFAEDIHFGEDSLFFCEYSSHCRNGGYIKRPFYYYYRNPKSATSKITYAVTQNIIAYERIDALVSHNNNMGKFTARAIWSAAKNFASDDDLYRKLQGDFDVRTAMKIMSKKGDELSLRISSILYLLNPDLFKKVICKYMAG